MKKKYMVIIVIILAATGILFEAFSGHMPLSPPIIIVTSEKQKIETAKGEYNWFDGRDGGNSCLSDSYDNLVKTIDSASVEKGQKIEFSFKTSWQQPDKNSLYLINFDAENHVQLEEQELNYNEFYAPEEAGEYIFLIDSWWDETHSVTNIIKVNVS